LSGTFKLLERIRPDQKTNFLALKSPLALVVYALAAINSVAKMPNSLHALIASPTGSALVHGWRHQSLVRPPKLQG
jgi:hypothetical protein